MTVCSNKPIWHDRFSQKDPHQLVASLYIKCIWYIEHITDLTGQCPKSNKQWKYIKKQVKKQTQKK